jgi:transketolase
MTALTAGHQVHLQEIARRLRAESLRMIHRRGAGHPGGALSAAEILAVLYFHFLKVDPAIPGWEDRDRFILSKGHASAALYAALSLRGFFPMSELDRWGDPDCPHQGHPDRLKTPGVDMTSGLLGHGVAIGAGLALAARLRGADYRTLVLIGDGECQGGIVWEGAAVASKYGLANLIGILDNNGVQLDGFVRDVMPIEPLAPRWAAWGWHVLEIDGHDVRQIADALDLAAASRDRPTMIIAHTVKGKGVSFMENDAAWHGGVPTAEQLRQALAELGEGG